jgi:hypothetical protein
MPLIKNILEIFFFNIFLNVLFTLNVKVHIKILVKTNVKSRFEYFYIIKALVIIIYVFAYFLSIKLISNSQIIYINILKKKL